MKVAKEQEKNGSIFSNEINKLAERKEDRENGVRKKKNKENDCLIDLND